MLMKLEVLLKRAYAPYTYCKSSAILVTKDGKEFYGVVVENAAPGATITAETNAINNAVSHGYAKGDFECIHIFSDSGDYSYPNYLSIQSLTEFFEGDNEIICYNIHGDTINLRLNDFYISHKKDSSNIKENEPEEFDDEENNDEDFDFEKYRQKFGISLEEEDL